VGRHRIADRAQPAAGNRHPSGAQCAGPQAVQVGHRAHDRLRASGSADVSASFPPGDGGVHPSEHAPGSSAEQPSEARRREALHIRRTSIPRQACPTTRYEIAPGVTRRRASRRSRAGWVRRVGARTSGRSRAPLPGQQVHRPVARAGERRRPPYLTTYRPPGRGVAVSSGPNSASCSLPYSVTAGRDASAPRGLVRWRCCRPGRRAPRRRRPRRGRPPRARPRARVRRSDRRRATSASQTPNAQRRGACGDDEQFERPVSGEGQHTEDSAGTREQDDAAQPAEHRCQPPHPAAGSSASSRAGPGDRNNREDPGCVHKVAGFPARSPDLARLPRRRPSERLIPQPPPPGRTAPHRGRRGRRPPSGYVGGRISSCPRASCTSPLRTAYSHVAVNATLVTVMLTA
jgi:hypothetical protein